MLPWIIMAVELALFIVVTFYLIGQTERQVRYWKREAQGLMDELMNVGSIGGNPFTKYHIIVFGCDDDEIRIGMKQVRTKHDKGLHEKNFTAMGRIVDRWHKHINMSMRASEIPEENGVKDGEGI